MHIYPVLPALDELNKSFPFKFLVLADPKYLKGGMEKLKKYNFIELRYELPPAERIYTYLHASDILSPP